MAKKKLTMYDIDPMGEAMFADESLELAERVGLGMIEAAKHNEIYFTKNILPTAHMNCPEGHIWYAFHGHGVSYFEDELVEKYPELKDEIHRRCVQGLALGNAG